MGTMTRRQLSNVEAQPLLDHGRTDEANSYAKLMETFASLREAAQEQYEESIHGGILRTLWRLAFPTDGFERKSQRWKELGFQGVDPTTDLRGAGVISLKHLLHTLPSFQELEDIPDDFPYAIASINCTAYLQGFLGLSHVVLPEWASVRCSETLLHNFLRLCVAEKKSALQIMHTQLLLHLAKMWRQMQTPTTTLLNFPSALKATAIHMQRSLEATRTPEQVRNAIELGVSSRWGSGIRWSDERGWCLNPASMFLIMILSHLGCGARSSPGAA